MTMLTFLLSLLFFLVFLFYATKNRLLPAMLVLESLVLMSLLISMFLLEKTDSSMFLVLLLLTLAVCEASLALSLLMSYIKISGTDVIRVSSGADK
uniref:NADH dehydrogenase subunit 4L n=1 Tax=Hemiphaedusa attrita attrita TaxID=1885691 RepID=A0A224ABL8_9EUPU|nr:NADH dehydrogenase subunit 4L [Hemiphaedusa attrita attrita]